MSKRLILMHGVPGSGKSTFIKNHKLEMLTISTDTLRLLFSEPKKHCMVDGHDISQISRDNNKMVWKLAFKALEMRLKNGSDTVFDACNFTQDYLRKYKDMADKYNFRVLVIDLSKVPLKLALARNESRLYQEDGMRYVPKNVIINFYKGMEPIPKDFDSIDGTAENVEELLYKWWNKF